MSPLQKLLAKRDKRSTELHAILHDEAGAERESLTPEQETRSTELLSKIDELDKRIEAETRTAKQQNLIREARAVAKLDTVATDTVDAKVTNEPKVYGPESRHSWFADMITLDRCSIVDPRYHTAAQRMTQWSGQVETEVAHGTKFGGYAERQIRERFRNADPTLAQTALTEARSRGRQSLESRAMSTGGGATASAAGGSGAAFVTPIFTEGDYAAYKEFGRAFADECYARPLPDYGMAIYMPQITGPASVATFTENNSVTELDPTMGYLSATLVIIAGEITLSQAVLDRTGPNFSFDEMCWDQLNRDYAPKFDTYVLNQVLAVCAQQSWTGNSGSFDLTVTSGSGGFYGQVSKAKAGIRTAAGTVGNPSSLFLVPTRYEYMAAWSDSQGRPIVVPDYAGPFNAAGVNTNGGDAGAEGYTGTRFNGLRVFTDNNIPNLGTTSTDQALVGDLRQVRVYEGQIVHRVLPQTLAGSLEVILQQYSYATVLIPYPKAVTAINGTGMSAISYTN